MARRELHDAVLEELDIEGVLDFGRDRRYGHGASVL